MLEEVYARNVLLPLVEHAFDRRVIKVRDFSEDGGHLCPNRQLLELSSVVESLLEDLKEKFLREQIQSWDPNLHRLQLAWSDLLFQHLAQAWGFVPLDEEELGDWHQESTVPPLQGTTLKLCLVERPAIFSFMVWHQVL